MKLNANELKKIAEKFCGKIVNNNVIFETNCITVVINKTETTVESRSGTINFVHQSFSKIKNIIKNISNMLDIGYCGESLTWILYNNGELVIDGTGEMWNWEHSSFAPWDSRRNSIKKVTIGDSVTTIGNYAFFSCRSLGRVEIGSGVTHIGDYAFSFCTSPTSVKIPDSVTSIGDYAFICCPSLASITVDANNTAYSNDEYGVLFNKNKTTLIQYPIGNTRTAYTIPDSITNIGDSAFFSCYSLTRIIIPNSVTSIGDYAFQDCKNLTSVKIGSGVTSICDWAFAYCISIVSVEIPDSVTSIGSYAFWDCYSLASVTIGNGVTSIYEDAFANCKNLTSVVIGSGVTSIGDYAFGGCAISKVTIYSNDAEFNSNVFGKTTPNFEIHGYIGSTVEEYAAAKGYKFVAIN